MPPPHTTEEPTTERWSALGGVLLSALYLWVILWLLLAVLLPSVGLGWRPVVITSGSMAPLIRPGDVVLSATTEEVEPGQVITYEDPAREDTLTTHRILSVNEDGTIRTQGDANPTPDSTLVPRDNVLGRGRLLVPLIGLPLVWLSSGAVLFGLWVVVTAISVAVVVGAGAGAGAPAAPPGNSATRQRLARRVLAAFQVVRPRTVQRAVVGALVDVAARVHDAVYSGHRPNPSRLRRGAPSLALLGLTLALARTPAAIALGVSAIVLVLLLDPDGPQFRIGRWERLATRIVRRARRLRPARLETRGVLVVAIVVAVAGSAVGRSSAVFSAAADNTGSTFTAASVFPGSGLTLYLQNEPEGQDTTSSAYLPMNGDVPTQSSLPNYDTNRDEDPGLRVKKGADDQFTTDTGKVQRWTYTPSSDLTLTSAQVVFHSAVKSFETGKGGRVEWYLRHCTTSGTDCVELAQAVLVDENWQAGSNGFVERTTSFGPLSQVVPAGRVLELVVIVPSFDDDLWLAYDTAAEPSRLEIS